MLRSRARAAHLALMRSPALLSLSCNDAGDAAARAQLSSATVLPWRRRQRLTQPVASSATVPASRIRRGRAGNGRDGLSGGGGHGGWELTGRRVYNRPSRDFQQESAHLRSHPFPVPRMAFARGWARLALALVLPGSVPQGPARWRRRSPCSAPVESAPRLAAVCAPGLHGRSRPRASHSAPRAGAGGAQRGEGLGDDAAAGRRAGAVRGAGAARNVTEATLQLDLGAVSSSTDHNAASAPTSWMEMAVDDSGLASASGALAPGAGGQGVQRRRLARHGRPVRGRRA